MIKKETFGLAIFGCGRWGKNHARNALAAFGPEVKYIVDPDESRRDVVRQWSDTVAFTADADTVWNDPTVTAVIISTPVETHFELTRQALLHNKHVLVEKPMALFSHQARELEKLAATKKRILMVGHILLFHPAIRKIKSLIDDGTIGRLQYIYSNRLNLGTVRKEENILWSFAPHDVSVLQYLTGSNPLEVQATGGIFLQPGIHDVTLTTLSYPENVKAHIHVSWLHPFKEHRLVVIGDRSMIVFEDTRAEDKLILYPKGIDWVNGEPIKRDEAFQAIEFPGQTPLEAEQAHFREAVLTNRPAITDGPHAVTVLEILEKAQASLESAPAENDGGEPAASENFFVHPTAVVDDGCQIGEGSKIWHFSHVQGGTTIGNNCSIGQNVNIGNNVNIGSHVKIQNNVSVYEGVELEDYVFCGPSMVFTNVLNPRCEFPQRGSAFYVKTPVRYGASIGANATIVCGNEIGRFAFIAAGAVVTKDVPEYALVVGNPGRIAGWMCRCGHKLNFKNEHTTCDNCSREYQRKGEGVVCLSDETE